MIVNTELRDTMYNGFQTKELSLSYINGSGDVDFLTTVLAPQELYKWEYAKAREIPDATFTSWDSKPVVRIPLRASDRMPDTRTQEIIYQLTQMYDTYKSINTLNMPHLAYCDIEVQVGDDGFPEAKDAKNRVNTIAWVDGTTVTVLGLANLSITQQESIQRRIDEHCKTFKDNYTFVYRYYESERQMLFEFMRDYVRPIPALTGWNFLRYDFLYLYNRCANLGIDITWISPTNEWTTYALMKLYNKKDKAERIKVPKHKLVFDYMEVYQKWDTSIYPHDSLKLDDVGEAAVGVKKVQHTLGFAEMWEQDPEGYVFYNAVDTILVREIDLKLKTAAIFFALANTIHCEANIAFSPVQSLQIFQTEYIFRESKVFCSTKEEREKEGYEGAFVYEPIPGAYRNVVALDFASLYPTTMRQFNISPDTFICKDKNRPYNPNEIKCKNGAVYRRDVEGILPKILTDVYNQRKAYKKKMMAAIDDKYKLLSILEKRIAQSGV